MIIRDDDVFDYHEKPRPGKLEVITSKPCLTQLDLSIAYTPGVARPCLAIEKDPELAERLFRKVLECEPDAYTKAWTHVYLGRLAEASGERERAVEEYKAALAVEGASALARQGAEKGLAAVSKK